MPTWTRRAGAIAALLLCLAFPSSELFKTLTPKPLPDLTEPVQWTEEQLAKPPNIIIVLSEAFWDITQLREVTFSRDPLPFFHALQAQYTHGTLLSPMFGGGTANVELEVLTGMSMRFFPENSIVYDEFIKQPTDSLASLLRGQGYRTTAIAPFYNWFFHSTDVYRRFGFERFISLEYFNPDEYVGPYIGDHAVAKRIIEETEKSAGPDFVFANTMENHYHYFAGKFKRNTIEAEGIASKEALAIAETYAQGVQGADRMLQELVTHFQSTKEPTVLVWFGDHLPSLEKRFVYEEAGYISGEDDPDFLAKMYNTPLLVWSNYLPRENKETLYISPSFLGPYVLRLTGRDSSAYLREVGAFGDKLPLVPPPNYYEAMNVDPALVEQYRAAQQSFWRAQQERSDSDPDQGAFELGYGVPALDSIRPETVSVGGDAFGRATLTLSGGRYGLGSTVFINGQPQQTLWLNEQTLSVSLPRELISQPGTLEIQVRVVDSQDMTLATSRTMVVPVGDKKPRG